MPAKPKKEEEEKEKMDYLQFRIPVSKKATFEAIVHKRYGMKHGGKTLVFLEMIEMMAKEDGL